MKITYGYDAGARKRGEVVPVMWDSDLAINGHALMVGMSGAGKTWTLRNMISQMLATAEADGGPLRFHVFDVHGDIHIDDASSVLFSEQTNHGMNPLKINPDPHFGGVRKRVQGFVSTINKVMHNLGPKQEAALRNVLLDVYHEHGFKQDDPSTWVIDEQADRMIAPGSEGRLYIDVPIYEKDDAKALGARWNGQQLCWWIDAADYRGGITRWPPKKSARAHPSIADVLRVAKNILVSSFLGAGTDAVTKLEIANKAATAFRRKAVESMRMGAKGILQV